MPRRREGLQATTAHRYQWIIEHYVEPELGSIPLRALCTEHPDRFYADLLDTGRADILLERHRREAETHTNGYGPIAAPTPTIPLIEAHGDGESHAANAHQILRKRPFWTAQWRSKIRRTRAPPGDR